MIQGEPMKRGELSVELGGLLLTEKQKVGRSVCSIGPTVRDGNIPAINGGKMREYGLSASFLWPCKLDSSPRARGWFGSYRHLYYARGTLPHAREDGLENLT